MSVETTDPIRVTYDGSVATIWLNRPAKRNAMNYAMWVLLQEAASQLGTDRRVRVVALRGSGDHFCAGADITELSISRRAGERSFAEVVAAAEAALADLPKPTIAFISGDCIGGGCSLAIDCDIRVATSNSRFGITPAKLGVVYPSGALERATHLLGPAVTKRLLFTGELISSDEALRVRLVDEIVDAADGEERLATLTGVLAARSLLTQAATKSMVAEVASHGYVSQAVQDHWGDVAAAAPDTAEGIGAFVEKRPARFTWSGPDGK
jgi:enoyl-CoA hydratase/carnithine racemase